jgi:hypothetical protein
VIAGKQPRETKTAKSRKKPTDDSKQTKLTLGRTAPVVVESGADDKAEKEADSAQESQEGTQGATSKGKGKEVEVEAPSDSQDIEMGDS